MFQVWFKNAKSSGLIFIKKNQVPGKAGFPS